LADQILTFAFIGQIELLLHVVRTPLILGFFNKFKMYVGGHIKIGAERCCSISSAVHLSQFIAEHVILWW